MRLRMRIKKNGSLPNWIFVLLFVALFMAYNVDFRVIKVPVVNMSIYQVMWYLLSGFMMLDVLLKQKYQKKNMFLIWSIGFVLFYLISLLWSLSSTSALAELKGGLSLFLMFSMLSFYLVDENAINRVLLANNLAIMVCAIYILGVVDRTQIGEIRLGANTDGLEAWNANSIGMLMSCAAVTAFYFLSKSHKSKEKLFNIASIVLFTLVTLYSGSRKALLILLLAVFAYMWFRNRGVKKLGVCFGALFVIVILLIVIMEVPSLYNTIGFRMEIMLEDLFGGGTNDSSYLSREIMIAYGLKWFLDSPIIGYGFTGFAYLFGNATGRAVYSHNNFVEILVSVGLLGFVLYYSIYWFAIVKNYRSVLQAKNDLAIMLFSINLALLVAQWANVSYFDPIYMLFLMLFVQIRSMRRRSDL